MTDRTGQQPGNYRLRLCRSSNLSHPV